MRHRAWRRRTSVASSSCLAVLALVAGSHLAGAIARAGAPPGGASATPAALAGRYAVRAKVHADAGALLGRDGETDLDVLVAAGPPPDGVRLRAASRGYACELAARVGRDGELQLDPGQACVADVAEPDARGHLDARLRSGRGRLAGGTLQLDLAFELSGALATRLSGERVQVLGTEVALPEGWTPQVPVRGTLTVSGSGRHASEGR